MSSEFMTRHSWLPAFALLLLLGGCQSGIGDKEIIIASEKPATEDPADSVDKPDKAPEKVSEVEPAVNPHEVQRLYALNLAKSGQIDQSIEVYQTLSELNPPFKNSLTSLGLLYLKNQLIEPAEQSLLAAVDQNPLDAVAWNHLALLHRQRGEFKQAQSAYQKALEIDQQYAGALLNYGILNDIYLQDLPTALELYQRYLIVSGDDETVKKWVIDLQRRIQ